MHKHTTHTHTHTCANIPHTHHTHTHTHTHTHVYTSHVKCFRRLSIVLSIPTPCIYYMFIVQRSPKTSSVSIHGGHHGSFHHCRDHPLTIHGWTLLCIPPCHSVHGCHSSHVTSMDTVTEGYAQWCPSMDGQWMVKATVTSMDTVTEG